MEPLTPGRVWRIALQAAIGLMLLLSGLVKGMHLLGFSGHLAQFEWFPTALAPTGALLVSALELLLGCALIAHFKPKPTRRATIALLLGFSLVFLIALARGYPGECGCYGPLLPITPVQTLIKNACLVLILGWLGGYPPYQPSRPGTAFGLLLSATLALAALGANTSLFDRALVKLQPGFSMTSLPSQDLGAKNNRTKRLVFILAPNFNPQAVKRAVAAFPDFEPVLLISGTPTAKIPGLTVLKAKPTIIAYYHHRLPTCFTLADDQVQRVWYGRLPSSLSD